MSVPRRPSDSRKRSVAQPQSKRISSRQGENLIPDSIPAWKDRYLGLILLLGGFLLFWDLSGRCLWEDEAETALLGKNIIRFGLPYAYDGTNVVSQEIAREFGPDFLWRWSPWMQFYIAAASMFCFGATTLAARLPFAILGFLSIPLTYALAQRLYRSANVARLSALFLTCSVPFLLHARQARWYSAVYVLILALFLSLDGMSKGKRISWVGFVLSAVLLFYTNFFVAIGLLASLAATAAVYKTEKRFLISVAAALVVIGLCVVPGFFFFNSFNQAKKFDIDLAFLRFKVYGYRFFTFLLPLPVLALLGYWLASRSSADYFQQGWKRTTLFLLIFSFVYIPYLAAGPWEMFRYVSVLLPLESILLGVTVFSSLRKSRLLGLALLALLLVTDAIHQAPFAYCGWTETYRLDALFSGPGRSTFVRTVEAGSSDVHRPTRSEITKVELGKDPALPSLGPVNFPLACFLVEIFAPPADPEWLFSEFLMRHARPGDVVLASYGDLSIQFYTGLKVTGGSQGQPLPTEPDWIVYRRFIMSFEPGRDGDVFQLIQSPKFALQKYDILTLRDKDSFLGNNPDPSRHCFKIPADCPPMVIFHKTGRAS
jgi:hypothetical protein